MKNHEFGVPRRFCTWIHTVNLNSNKKFMENHEFTYIFMKKKCDFGGTNKGLRMNSYTWSNSYVNAYSHEFIQKPWQCSMALREAASTPPALAPSSESRRPLEPGGSLAVSKSGRQLQALSWTLARPGRHCGHAVSPGPVAAPTQFSRGRHTAGLCQRPCRSAPRWPARSWRWCSEAEPIRRLEHPDQPFTAQWPA